MSKPQKSSLLNDPSRFIRWFNERAAIRNIRSVNTTERKIIFGGDHCPAELTLTRPDPLGNWVVSWRINRSDNPQEHHAWIGGECVFTHQMIRAAFGLEDKVENSFSEDLDAQFREKYRADVAVVGHFLRQGNKLNIPGNNTNFEQRRAVSVLISKDMQRFFLDTTKAGDANVLGDKWPF